MGTMIRPEEVNENLFWVKAYLSLPTHLYLEDSSERMALASLTDEQLEMLRDDERFLRQRYSIMGVEDLCEAALAWARRDGELTPETLFEKFHLLMSIDSKWTAVYSDSIEQLASEIVEDTFYSIEYAFNHMTKSHSDHTDERIWKSFLAFDGGDYVKFLENNLREKYHAFEVTHGREKIVIFEAPEKIPTIA